MIFIIEKKFSHCVSEGANEIVNLAAKIPLVNRCTIKSSLIY